jgi:tellurite resistance protein TerC
MLERFKYLHYGLGALLAFAALKMMAAQWVELPIAVSLAVIGAILAVCAAVSWSAGAKRSWR